MTAESAVLLAAAAAVTVAVVIGSMALGWVLRGRDDRRMRDTARALRGRVHELEDCLALEQRVVLALGEHLPEDTVRTAVDAVTGASEGRHGR